MDEQKLISVANYGGDICDGCGGYTPDGEPTGNRNVRHSRLHMPVFVASKAAIGVICFQRKYGRNEHE